jgi:hypothetical protein
MASLLDSLNAQSRQIREAVLADADAETLCRLMEGRELLVRHVSEAVSRGERFAPGQIQAWEEVEHQVLEALVSRRDEVGRQLASRRRARSVETAYRSAPGGASRYLDRAG